MPAMNIQHTLTPSATKFSQHCQI